MVNETERDVDNYWFPWSTIVRSFIASSPTTTTTTHATCFILKANISVLCFRPKAISLKLKKQKINIEKSWVGIGQSKKPIPWLHKFWKDHFNQTSLFFFLSTSLLSLSFFSLSLFCATHLHHTVAISALPFLLHSIFKAMPLTLSPSISIYLILSFFVICSKHLFNFWDTLFPTVVVTMFRSLLLNPT